MWDPWMCLLWVCRHPEKAENAITIYCYKWYQLFPIMRNRRVRYNKLICFFFYMSWGWKVWLFTNDIKCLKYKLMPKLMIIPNNEKWKVCYSEITFNNIKCILYEMKKKSLFDNRVDKFIIVISVCLYVCQKFCTRSHSTKKIYIFMYVIFFYGSCAKGYAIQRNNSPQKK